MPHAGSMTKRRHADDLSGKSVNGRLPVGAFSAACTSAITDGMTRHDDGMVHGKMRVGFATPLQATARGHRPGGVCQLRQESVPCAQVRPA